RLDGVEMVFQVTPDTEAPAEMHMFYPELRALNLAENATHNLHNTYPIRGAQVRDANAWAKYIDEALACFAPGADVVFAQHHWPVWGRARLEDFLRKQRDLYKYLHDQTVRLMNHGYRAAEIAERLALPRSLARTWHVRGYYGTLSHNAKAVYQRYLGWYDANPAHLNPLPPVPRARKYVEYMGGAAAALARAREDFARGEYRFVAEAMSHLVFADPANVEARALGADALEQLGYQAESATWRNAYLLGALELRQGRPHPAARAPVSPDLVRAMSLDLFFDYLAVRLDAERAEGKSLTVNWVLPDTGERYALTLEHCALTYRAGRPRRHRHPRPPRARPPHSPGAHLRRRGGGRAGGGGRRRGQGRRAVRPLRRLHLDVPGGGAAAGGRRAGVTSRIHWHLQGERRYPFGERSPDPEWFEPMGFPPPWPDRPWIYAVMVASANAVVAWRRAGPDDDPVVAVLGGNRHPDERLADRRHMRHLRCYGDVAIGAQTLREQPELVQTPQAPGDEPMPALAR